MSLPPGKFSSKREAIIELVKEGGHSNEEIAHRTATSKSYVAKIKSLYRAELKSFGEVSPFFLGEMPPGHVPSEPSAPKYGNEGRGPEASNEDSHSDIDSQTEEGKKVSGEDRRKGRGDAQRIDINDNNNRKRGRPKLEPSKAGSVAYYPAPMDNEIRKMLWTAFDAKKTLVDIIKEHGYSPEKVEREYRTFLRFQGINLTEMQGAIIRNVNKSKDHLIKGPLSGKKEEYEGLVAVYSDKGYLGTQQFLSLIGIDREIAYWKGKESISNLKESLPGKWKRPICAQCGRPLEGALYDSTFGFNYIQEIASSQWMHQTCARQHPW